MADSSPVAIRTVEAADAATWRSLWHAFVVSTGGDPSKVSTDATWDRLLDPASPIHGWVGTVNGGAPVGFVHCVIHLNTFGDRPVCYLEDLFVDAEARGSGMAGELIDTVVAAAREEGWSRVYWHAGETNYRARALYDRLAKRSDHVRYEIRLA